MLAALKNIYRTFALAYYEWALHEIDPAHPDVPYIVHRLNELRQHRDISGRIDL